jgi:predicted protein tyrosine phosphatase
MFAEIIPGLLFLGDAAAASDVEAMRDRNISMVVNAASADMACLFEGHDEWPIDYLRLSLDDDPDEPVLPYAVALLDFIARAAERGCSVLVACVAGVSRSATLVLIYLLKHENMTLRDALDLVLDAKPDVLPNRGFFKQLVQLEKRLYGVNTLALLDYSSLSPSPSPSTSPLIITTSSPAAME